MVLGDSKKKWLHSADVLIRSRVSYQVKFIGKAEVNQPKGIEVARAALQKLSFNKQLKRSEGTKPAKVQLSISIKGITVSDSRSKEVLHNVPLHLISFCSDDKKDKHLFSFIAKIGEDKHFCFGFESTNEANNIVLSIGQAFEVAYQDFLKKKQEGGTPVNNSKQMMELHKKVSELAMENSKLKERIAQLEGSGNTKHQHQAAKEGGDNFGSSTLHNDQKKSGNVTPSGAGAATTDPFDMTPFVATPTPPALVKLPSPQDVHPNAPKSATTRSSRSQKQPNYNQAILDSTISFENNTLPQSSLPPALLAFDPLHNK